MVVIWTLSGGANNASTLLIPCHESATFSNNITIVFLESRQVWLFTRNLTLSWQFCCFLWPFMVRKFDHLTCVGGCIVFKVIKRPANLIDVQFRLKNLNKLWSNWSFERLTNKWQGIALDTINLFSGGWSVWITVLLEVLHSVYTV